MRQLRMNFIFITLLLLLTRCTDFYSTSLWFFQEGGIKDETNPLTVLFGVGWEGLIVTNLIIVGLITGAFYYYTFVYKLKLPTIKPKNILEYISICYYDRPDKFYWIFYKMPIDKKTALGHMGYSLIRVLIVGSALATIHNLCQYYRVEIYSSFRELVGRPLFIIYGLIALSWVISVWTIAIKEFRQLKNFG
jgi:hypothetical protein